MCVDNRWFLLNKDLIQSLTGYKVKRWLGSGSYGAVFSTTDPKIAIKVTTHGDEVKTLALVQQLREQGLRLPGIINVHLLAHFQTSRKSVSLWARDKGDFFIIVRELLRPTRSNDFDSWALNHHMQNMNLFEKCEYKIMVRSVFSKHRSTRDTILRLAENDIYLWDIRPSNTGMRGKSLVIHDVVAARPLPKVTIPSFGYVKSNGRAPVKCR